jgi:hypothetical protein
MSHADTALGRSAGRSQADKLLRLRGASIGAVAMLILEFILGMIYNLYGTAPTPKKSIGLFSSPVIALHVILGFLLFVAAVALLTRAIVARHGLSILLSAVGAIAIVYAGFAGLGFAGNGAAGASLGMSIAFAVALGCYVALLVGLAPAPAAARALARAEAPRSSTASAPPSSTT